MIKTTEKILGGLEFRVARVTEQQDFCTVDRPNEVSISGLGLPAYRGGGGVTLLQNSIEQENGHKLNW